MDMKAMTRIVLKSIPRFRRKFDVSLLRVSLIQKTSEA